MAKRRRKYPIEFKQEAVRLVVEEGLSYAQLCRDLGVDRSVVRAWTLKAEAGELEERAPKKRTEPDVEDELRRLRRENAILREERDILKKAAAFFAKESQ